MEEMENKGFDILDWIRKWGIYIMFSAVVYLAKDKWESTQQNLEQVQQHQEQHLQKIDESNLRIQEEFHSIKETQDLMAYRLERIEKKMS